MENNEDEINFDKINEFFKDQPIKQIDIEAIDERSKSARSRLDELKRQLDIDIKVEAEQALQIIESEPVENVTKVNNTPRILYGDFTDEQLEFIDLMIPMRFNITHICDEIGINRKTYYDWLKNKPGFQEAIDDVRQYLIDKSESVLLQALDNADAKTAQFILTKLDKRYKDSIDITSNGQTMGSIINIIIPADE